MATTLPLVSTPVKRPWVCSGVKSRETPLSVTYWHSSTPDAAAESTLRVSIGEEGGQFLHGGMRLQQNNYKKKIK